MIVLCVVLAIALGAGLTPLARVIYGDFQEKNRARARSRISEKVHMNVPNKETTKHRARSGHPVTMQSW